MRNKSVLPPRGVRRNYYFTSFNYLIKPLASHFDRCVTNCFRDEEHGMMGIWPDPTYYLIRFDLFRTLMQKHDVAFVCSQQLFQASRQALRPLRYKWLVDTVFIKTLTGSSNTTLSPATKLCQTMAVTISSPNSACT